MILQPLSFYQAFTVFTPILHYVQDFFPGDTLVNDYDFSGGFDGGFDGDFGGGGGGFAHGLARGILSPFLITFPFPVSNVLTVFFCIVHSPR